MQFRSLGLTRGLVVLTLAAVLMHGAVWAAEEEVNNGQDPTKPLTRIDLRYQYQNLPPDDHDNAHIFTPRADKPFPLAPHWSLATRLDLPLFLTEAINPDNRDGDYEFGLGDLLLQGLLIHSPSQRFAWAMGAQLIFPTASTDGMGGGKYRIVPTLGARYALPEITRGTFAAFLLRYDVDYAGDDDRRHISELQLAPLVNIALPAQWFVNLYPSSDIRYNFTAKRPGDTGRWFFPFNFMVGKMVTRSMVASVEIGVPIVDDYKVYDFKLEARVGLFF
jgi:hypothetical protein